MNKANTQNVEGEKRSGRRELHLYRAFGSYLFLMAIMAGAPSSRFVRWLFCILVAILIPLAWGVGTGVLNSSSADKAVSLEFVDGALRPVGAPPPIVASSGHNLGIWLVIAVIVTFGIVLVGAVLSDVFKRLRAKRALARHLSYVGEEQLKYLQWFVASPMPLAYDAIVAVSKLRSEDLRRAALSSPSKDAPEPRPATAFQTPPPSVPQDVVGWVSLMAFLHGEGSGLGRLASEALFQRSRHGRAKYLESVLRTRVAEVA